MFERLAGFGFVLYLFLIGLAVAAIGVAARVASSTFAELTIARSATSQPSRVKTGLEAQERQAQWQSTDHVLERPPVPDVSAAALAKGLEAAETHSLPAETHSPPTDVSSKARPTRPRVAGWMKRDKPKAATSLADESPSLIITRSLRGEM
ncbi:unnamed protein product [marine sediment metagenome]|uniref:Uncharacterized protein n=1 Tax=marine sediment metagenome TaxID=412755 RepID=X0V8B2_9ZZZZ